MIEEDDQEKPAKGKKQKPAKEKSASTRPDVKSKDEASKRKQKPKDVRGKDDDVLVIEEDIKEKPAKGKKQNLLKKIMLLPNQLLKVKRRQVKENRSPRMEEDREFKTQCRPQGLSELIDTFNEKQKADVKSIGFGGLPQVSIKQLSTGLMKQLVAKFHSGSRMLRIEHHAFAVTPADIYDVLLLLRNSGKDVIEMKHRDKLVDVSIIKDWMQKYNLQWNSPYKDVKEVLVQMKNGGDDFKRLFVVFSLPSFLAPNANRTTNFNVVHSLLDVENIRDFDWCFYVLKRLCWLPRSIMLKETVGHRVSVVVGYYCKSCTFIG